MVEVMFCGLGVYMLMEENDPAYFTPQVRPKLIEWHEHWSMLEMESKDKTQVSSIVSA